MAKAPARTVGIFSTHRGQFVKRVSLSLFALSFLLMVLNGVVNGRSGGGEEEAGKTDNPEMVRVDPKVEPAPVNPFKVKEKIEPVVAPQSGTDENSLFQSAIATAGQGVTQYATYSHQQAPDGYIQLIPGLSTEVRKSLLEASKVNWPEIEADQVTSKATIRGTQPQVVAFDAEKGTASVTVSVAQAVTTRDKQYLFSRSYMVRLQSSSSATTQWEITGIGTV